MNNYFHHHGMDGQKWGKRNGPPYPLNRDSMGRIIKKKQKKIISPEEAKNRAIKSGNVKEVKKYKHMMTERELEEALRHIDWEYKLNSAGTRGVNDAIKNLDTYMKTVNTGIKLGMAVSSIFALLANKKR